MFMQLSGLRSSFFIGLMSILALQGCKKVSNIGTDNDSVITTPYNLYAGSNEGWLVNTNDGRTFKSVFPPDGYPIKMVSNAGSNIIMLKSQLFYSDNNGVNFNPITYSDYKPYEWNGWILDAPRHARTYMTSDLGRGVVTSADNGLTWQVDDNFEANTSASIKISSFAKDDKGTVYAFSHLYNVLYKKEAATAPFTAVTAEGVFAAVSEFFLVSNGSELLISDYKGVGGAWITQDYGIRWVQFGQGILPNDGSQRVIAAASGKTGTICVATANNVYFASTNIPFTSGNSGLESNTIIRNITAKTNIYKNGNKLIFLYLATNTGMYRSDDGGRTWDKVTNGIFNADFVSVY